MRMLFSRYSTVRARILFLYNILTNRQYPIWVAPKTLMSMEDLRDRYELKQEGFANDTTYFDSPQLRKMKIPQLLTVLTNVTSANDIGFNNANHTVVEIYESIQEYIGLWCELARTAQEITLPPREELRLLETLALHIFPLYRRVKPFRVNEEIREATKGDPALHQRGLAGLGMLFTMARMGTAQPQEISFISHLDDLEGSESAEFIAVNGPVGMGNYYPTMQSNFSDSISRVETSVDVNDWVFKE